jgi:16S rRNA (adenine1518-N6/adenine1519-N6)-dimethyltransferase
VRRPRLGQHFLTDQRSALKIVEAANLSALDQVLEIGPGKGALTSEIFKRADKVVVVEKDEALAQRLGRIFPNASRFLLFNRDFLDFDLACLGDGPFVVLSNLPYAVGTLILQKLLIWPHWTKGVFMLQKEVAARVAAFSGGDYGILSLSVFLHAEAEVLFDVGPESFSPSPTVWSSVVRLKRRVEPMLSQLEEVIFYRLAKAAFGQRRKMALGRMAEAVSLSRDEMERYFKDLGLASGCRAQDIPPQSYLQLARLLVSL